MDNKTFAVTRENAFRKNQTVRHVYRDAVPYSDVQQATWNRLARELDVAQSSDVNVFQAVCGMDVDRIPREFEMVGGERLEAMVERGAVCGRCFQMLDEP